MVISSYNSDAYSVLLSDESRCWKIADFGISAEGTSNGAQVTMDSRGSSSYRAPELLGENPTFNNKTDIWALGCILYELFSGVKAFNTDYGTLDYKRTTDLELPVPWPEFDDLIGIADVTFPVAKAMWLLKEQFEAMLSLDPSERLGAKVLQKSWKQLRQKLTPPTNAQDQQPSNVNSNSLKLSNRCPPSFWKPHQSKICASQ